VPQPVWSNRVDDLGAPMLSLMNVRYMLTKEGTLIENPHALPRAFVPRVVHVGAGDGTIDQLKGVRDFGAEAWIASRESYTQTNGEGDLAVRRDGTRLLIHASMRGPGWVVVSEPAWKGWRATRARVPLRLHLADHAFLAFYLPAGESDVTLRYLPSGFVYGALVSALALLSTAITFFMSAHTSFFAAGLRRR
jgi:hypothetical protein